MLSQYLKLSKVLLGAFLVVGLTLSFNAHASLASELRTAQQAYSKLSNQVSRVQARAENLRGQLEAIREQLKNQRTQVKAAQAQKAKAQRENNNTDVQRYRQLVKRHQEAAKEISERFKALRKETLKAEAKLKGLQKRLAKKAEQIHRISAEVGAAPRAETIQRVETVGDNYVVPAEGVDYIIAPENRAGRARASEGAVITLPPH